ADLNNNGFLEVIAHSGDGKLYCISHLGIEIWNLTITSPSANIFSSPSIGDLDNDDTLEIVIGGYNNNKIFCVNHLGTEEWNYTTGGSIRSSAAFADLDNDDTLEVLIGSFGSDLYCLSHSGEVEWIFATTYGIYPSPIVVDLENDGIKEAIISDSVYCYCINLTDVSSSGLQEWTMFRGSIFHSGQMDSDGDYIDDQTELYYDVNPLNNDTDYDQLEDWDEIYYYQTDPSNEDTDGDTVTDGDEVLIYFTDPLDPNDHPILDSDNDGLLDDVEILLGTDPNNPDTDYDLLTDGDEVLIYFTDPTKDDTDNDFLEDGEEIKGIFSPFNPGANATGYVHTNATNIDSDSDTFSDTLEIIMNSNPNDPLSLPFVSPPPETITLPPETITHNQTITITAGIILGSVVLLVAFSLTVTVIVYRRRRK
ncbi:MAG: FG-GAP-like repeat-containing protein, partial [Candidatus Heimdallarchaeota archaeon]